MEVKESQTDIGFGLDPASKAFAALTLPLRHPWPALQVPTIAGLNLLGLAPATLRISRRSAVAS